MLKFIQAQGASKETKRSQNEMQKRVTKIQKRRAHCLSEEGVEYMFDHEDFPWWGGHPLVYTTGASRIARLLLARILAACDTRGSVSAPEAQLAAAS